MNDPRYMNSAGLDVYNEQNIESSKPKRSKYLDRKEIGRNDFSETHLGNTP